MKRIILFILALMFSLSAISAQAAGGGQEKLLTGNLQGFSDGIHAFQSLTIKMWVGSDLIPFPCKPVGLVDLNGDGNRELLALSADLSAGSGTLMIWSADRGEVENVLYLPDATMTYEDSTSDLVMYFVRDGSSVIEYETMDGWGAVRLASDGNRIAIADMLTREDDGLQGETDVCTRNGDFIDVSEYKALVSGWQKERTETICAFPWPEKNCFGFGYTWEEAMDALENGTGSEPAQPAPDSSAGNETGNEPDPAVANNPQAETAAASGTEEVEVDPRVSRIFTTYECGCTDSSYGVMVSRNGLITRAVTIYCPRHGQKYSRLEFFFGFVNDELFAARYDGDFSFTAYEQFKKGYEKENDIAFIRFAEPVGDETGWYACKAASDKELKKSHLVLRLDTVRGRIQADAPSVKVLNKKFLSYTYMKGTASGVPTLIEDGDGNRTVIGICTAYDPEDNVGYIRRITSRVYNDMKADGLFKGSEASSAPSVTSLPMPAPALEPEPELAASTDAVHPAPVQPSQADGNGWICQNCGAEGNTGNFCVNCGAPKPEEKTPAADGEWTCGNCGQEGNKGAFCTNCGTKKPEEGQPASTAVPSAADDSELDDRLRLLKGLWIPNKESYTEDEIMDFDHTYIGKKENGTGTVTLSESGDLLIDFQYADGKWKKLAITFYSDHMIRVTNRVSQAMQVYIRAE